MDQTKQEQINSGVYVIVCNGNGKIYIGGSTDIKKRIMCHTSSLNRIKHGNVWLQSAWNIYGKEHFSFNVIEYCEKDKIKERENFWFLETESYKEENGFNANISSSLNIKNCFRPRHPSVRNEKIFSKNGAIYYSSKQVSEIFGVSDRTVYAWIRTKKIKAESYRMREKLISKDEIKNFISKYWGYGIIAKDFSETLF